MFLLAASRERRVMQSEQHRGPDREAGFALQQTATAPLAPEYNPSYPQMSSTRYKVPSYIEEPPETPPPPYPGNHALIMDSYYNCHPLLGTIIITTHILIHNIYINTLQRIWKRNKLISLAHAIDHILLKQDFVLSEGEKNLTIFFPINEVEA